MGEVLINCPCNHCSGFLEFDASAVGQSVPCPHCGLDTTLFQPTKSTQSTTPKALDPGGDESDPSRTSAPPLHSPPASILIRNPSLRLCATCGSVVPRRVTTPGSIWLEIFLWGLFLLPGLLYSIWRLAGRHVACPYCDSRDLLPLDSPRAALLAQQLNVDIDLQVPYQPRSKTWLVIKALLIAGSVMAFILVWNKARENDAIMRDLDRIERRLR